MDEKKASIDNKEENEKNISDRRTDSVKCSSEQGGRVADRMKCVLIQ